MTLTYILAFAAVVLMLGWTLRNRTRVYFLMTVSALAVYLLQPILPIRGLDFWLATATLALTVLSWLAAAPAGAHRQRGNLLAFGLLLGVILLVDLGRYLGLESILAATLPPRIGVLLAFLAVLAAALSGALLVRRLSPAFLLVFCALLLLGLFLILKVPSFAMAVSGAIRAALGRPAGPDYAADLRWIGFSYIAFRLLHTIRDRQSGRLPDVSLAEYVTYVIFFPSLTAGPIDRIERFIQDLRRPFALDAAELTIAGQRLVVGLFKKFVLADSLALVALNGANALQVRTAGWMWVVLYAYAFQIYFDFGGYTDIAIGLGRLAGIKLPENFIAPYLKPNLTQFWNNWHMTLTQWFRAYFFNPVTRFLRSGKRRLPIPLIIFITQLGTMLLIGLWHGVTWNFILWGAWHGVGLFVQNRWSEFVRPRLAGLEPRKWLNGCVRGLSTFLTFQYVALGWVWFALPDVNSSLQVFLELFGLTLSH
jgi:D-alanyl-lipoteichoic acid acyltransferase DltB (MBOAT superfamily)